VDALIEMSGLSKWYGEVVGLNNVTAVVPPGITGLLGHNGAGKTTLLSLITGQLRPSLGRVTVFGKAPWNNPRLLSSVGFCPEADAFWRGLTGAQFVEFLARANGLRQSRARRAAQRALELVGMSEEQHRRIDTYSRGMRQRVKVAQALAHNPRLLVLDEPLAGTDPVGRAHLMKLFGRLADSGTSVIVSSHILHEIEAMTSNILLIDHGQLVAEGDVSEIREHTEERSRRVLVRTPQSRRLAGLLCRKEYVTALEIVDGRMLTLRTPEPSRLFDELPPLLLDNGISCTEIASPDDNLEAIFSYLTARSQ
jgi:ABC-2 type transport system ATP-binding protein